MSRRSDGPETQDTYTYQREELIVLLQSCAARHEPLVVNGEILLRPDDIYSALQKIKQRHHFSRRERQALTQAGFDLKRVFPDLV